MFVFNIRNEHGVDNQDKKFSKCLFADMVFGIKINSSANVCFQHQQ